MSKPTEPIETTEAEKLAAALEEIQRLQRRIGGLIHEGERVRSALDAEQRLSKNLGDENTRLREQVLGVVHRFGPHERCCSVEISMAAFYMLRTEEREEYLRDVVIDMLRKLLHQAGGAAHLETLRKKVGA